MSARLENWSIYGGRLYGNVYAHVKFTDGFHITTSAAKQPHPEFKRGDLVETQNTIYRLGEPNAKSL